MPAGGSRPGRRDNGLIAAEYAAVGDVDPRVGEHLLDVLAGVGIAAYLLPAADLHPLTRTTTLPARPTDRLYADRAHLGTARDYLARVAGDERGAAAAAAPGDTVDPDVEAVWASIVAAYDSEVDATAPAPWPAVEDLPERGHDDTDPDLGRRLHLDLDEEEEEEDEQLPRREPEQSSLLDGLDTFGAHLPAEADEDEGYTPPPPPPVPRPPAQVVLAVLAIVAGLVLFFRPGILQMDADAGLLVGFGLLLAGVITLIWRLRPGDEEDEDSGDDGAVV